MTTRSLTDRLTLLIGTGLGSGYLRPASGTWGSLVGFAYFWGLLHLPLAIAAAVTAAVIALSIWVSGRCVLLFSNDDPSQVVIDEIAAVPLAAWPITLMDKPSWWIWIAVFVAWRIADIIKPSPARQFEALPGGWGVVADDLMSAAYVGALFWLGVRLGWIR
jgi:phosphatidylglycerophosphatase A